MKIAVLSGKGGTGKTLLSVNLAAVAAGAERGVVTYVDCDVEEPNGRLFLKPTHIIEENVSVKIPSINKDLCSGCRKCLDFCKFNALALIKDKVLVFEEVCHSCGGCKIVCPESAISEKDRVIGKIEKGSTELENLSHHLPPCPSPLPLNIYTGILNTGEVSGVPIIRQLLAETCEDSLEHGDVFIDCPPGCACVVMESIKDADFCVLVAEPTIFGVHNLEMVYELVSMFGKKFGVALNKCLDGKNPAEDFCVERGINIVGRIPFDKELGLINSQGDVVSVKNEKYRKIFTEILENIRHEVLVQGSGGAK